MKISLALISVILILCSCTIKPKINQLNSRVDEKGELVSHILSQIPEEDPETHGVCKVIVSSVVSGLLGGITTGIVGMVMELQYQGDKCEKTGFFSTMMTASVSGIAGGIISECTEQIVDTLGDRPDVENNKSTRKKYRILGVRLETVVSAAVSSYMQTRN